MPRTPEQFEKLRKEKRSQIMDAALELFANEGYHNTSISKIAQKAGISKGLMYNYFKSKEELVSSIIDNGIEVLEELFDPNNDGVLTADEFDFFVNRYFDVLVENLSYWKLYFGIMMQPIVFDMVREKYNKIIEGTLALLVKYYKKQGVEDPESEAILFGALMDGISINYILNPDLFPLEKIKKTIIERFSHKD